MKFGVRVAESTNTDSGGDWIRYFKKGETRIRLLDEIDDWTEYWAHFNQSVNRDYPCTSNKAKCPGCNSSNEREAKASKRYLANAVQEGYVNLYKIPASIKAEFDRFADKDSGSILKRDYTVVRMETDAGTKYTVDREERDGRDLTEFKPKDHQVALKEAFVEVWGQEPNEDGGIDLATSAAAAVAQQAKQAEREEQQAVEKDLSEAEKRGLPADPPSEPQEEPGEKVLTEDGVRSMSVDQILGLFKQCQITPPETDNAQELADALIAALN